MMLSVFLNLYYHIQNPRYCCIWNVTENNLDCVYIVASGTRILHVIVILIVIVILHVIVIVILYGHPVRFYDKDGYLSVFVSVWFWKIQMFFTRSHNVFFSGFVVCVEKERQIDGVCRPKKLKDNCCLSSYGSDICLLVVVKLPVAWRYSKQLIQDLCHWCLHNQTGCCPSIYLLEDLWPVKIKTIKINLHLQ